MELQRLITEPRALVVIRDGRVGVAREGEPRDGSALRGVIITRKCPNPTVILNPDLQIRFIITEFGFPVIREYQKASLIKYSTLSIGWLYMIYLLHFLHGTAFVLQTLLLCGTQSYCICLNPFDCFCCDQLTKVSLGKLERTLAKSVAATSWPTLLWGE